MVIYKYLDQRGAIKTVKKNSVLLRTPDKFNDPFDCVFESNDEEMEKAFRLYTNYQCFKDLYNFLIKKNTAVNKNHLLAKVQRHNLKTIAEKVFANNKYTFDHEIETYYQAYKLFFKKNDIGLKKQFRETIRDIYLKIRQMALVSCFSLTSDSILMWSHYADHHFGACIEFEIDDKNFKEVEYVKEKKSFKLARALEFVFGSEITGKNIDFEDKSLMFALEPIITKSEKWIYEKEVRCVFPINKKYKKINSWYKKLLLEMPPIKKIIVGCKADKDFIDKLKEVSGSIPITKMETVDGEYKVVETNL